MHCGEKNNKQTNKKNKISLFSPVSLHSQQLYTTLSGELREVEFKVPWETNFRSGREMHHERIGWNPLHLMTSLVWCPAWQLKAQIWWSHTVRVSGWIRLLPKKNKNYWWVKCSYFTVAIHHHKTNTLWLSSPSGPNRRQYHYSARSRGQMSHISRRQGGPTFGRSFFNN